MSLWVSIVVAGLSFGQGPMEAPAQAWVDAGAYIDLHLVIPEHPSETMQYAVETFKKYWFICAGFEIKASPFNEGRVNVWLGPETLTPDLLDPAELEDLGEEGCIVRTLTPRKREMKQGAMKQLIITGATDRGTLNGVFEFFQRVVDKQWLAPDVQNLAHPRSTLPEMDYRIVPPFAYREVGYFGMWMPGALEFRRAHRFPDAFRPGPFEAHTFYELLPPKQHFAEHPEFYAELEGKRTAFSGDWKDAEVVGRAAQDQCAQLCCGNPAVAEAIVRVLLERVRAHPEVRVWSVSQMDWLHPCQCPVCREIDGREGSPSGSLLTLVNRVAEALDTAFPGQGYRVHTLAHRYSRRPPAQLRPRGNVLVQVSDIECDFAHALDDGRSAVNAAFVRDLKGWARLTENLYVWDHASSLRAAYQPFPNFHVIQPNLQLFDQFGVKGVYEETWGARGGTMAEFDLFRCFLLSKCLWDQDAPVDALAEGFLRDYYGPAAQPIGAYLRLLTKQTQRTGGYLGCLEPMHWMDYDTVTQAEALFEEALGMKLSEEQQQRVRIARLPVAYAALLCPPRIQQQGGVLAFDRPPCLRLEEFIAALKALGAGLNETAACHPIRDIMQACGGVTPPRHEEYALVALENDRELLWVLPDLRGAIVRWRHKQPGVELLRGFERCGAAPGLWEDWTETSAGCAGPAAARYALKEQSPERVLLEATLDNGLVLTREIAFLSEPDSLSVRLSVTNPSGQAVTFPLKSHPEFFCQTAAEPELWGFENGTWARLAAKEGYEAGCWNALRRPAGGMDRWAFHVPERNLTLTCRFQPSETGEVSAYCNFLPSRQQMNLELTLPGGPLGPGETRSMSAVYCVSDKRPGPSPSPEG